MSDKNVYYCVGCAEIHPRRSFYKSYNHMHGNGTLPFCKDFIKDKVYDRKGENPSIEQFQNILMQLNMPYLHEIMESALARGGDVIGIYFSQFNSLPQNRGLVWANSSFEQDDDEEEFEFIDKDFRVTQGVISFWGSTFSEDEYKFLENEFHEYISAYECDSPAMRSLLQQAAYESLEIRKKREKRESVGANLKTLQDLLTSANVKPVQETGVAANDQVTFGTLIKKWENDDPIPEPLPEWKDKDVIQYAKVWFLGHLTRMVDLENPYKKDYEDELKKHTIDIEDGETDG